MKFDWKSFSFLFFFLFLTNSSSSLWAAKQPEISVKAEVDRAFITIGELVQYTVTVRHHPSIKIISAIPSPAEDVLKIKKVEDIHRQEGSSVIEGRKFTLTAFSLGQFILDPVEIKYQSDGQATQTLQTDRIFLTVKSVAEGETKTDIKGVKGVIDLPKNITFFIVLVVLALTSMIGFLIYQRLRRSPDDLKMTEPLLSPEEEALSRLNKLFDSDYIRRGKIKEYYLLFSEILRNYLERRFQILAVESTTYEILRDLSEKEADQSFLNLLKEVLEAADLAKFAKWTPEPSQIIALNQKSKQIVEMGRPKEAPSGV